MPDAFGNPTLEEINLAAAAQQANPAWLATQLYYPISVFGSRMWVPCPPGPARVASAIPRSQIPAGEDIRDAGMETEIRGPGGPSAAPPGTGALVPATTTVPAASAATENVTARARAAQLLYNALRGMPFVSQEFLTALAGGQLPAPRTLTPQTLAALNADTTLSDAFFSLVKASAVYPDSYLAEIGRYMPRGMQATPSFI
jgi:hypothetical protein